VQNGLDDIHVPRLLQRTFDILEFFTQDKPRWTSTEIGRASGLPVPTAFRLLSALHENGYLIKDSSKRYCLVPALLKKGRYANFSRDVNIDLGLREFALPYLATVARETAQTTLLMTLAEDSNEAVCIECVEGFGNTRVSFPVGYRIPLHAGASQKVILAHMPVGTRAQYLQRPLRAICRSTLTERPALEAELRRVHHRGWAFSNEEATAGLWCMAVGLLEPTGECVAAIGAIGASSAAPVRPRDVLPSVVEAAVGLAERLDLVPSIVSA
jgi:DNA-binding IclR family transcriptional regulator